MDSFPEWADARRANQTVWLSGGRPIGRRDVSRLFSDERVLALAERRVALGPMSGLELAASLVALNGVVDTILLLPTDESGDVRDRWLAQARIDLVLEGSGLDLASKLLREESTFEPRRSARAPVKTSWLLATSGTSGVPKLIAHSLSSLCRSLASRPPRHPFVWGSLYSLRRFAGLQVLLQAFAGGTPLIVQDDDLEFVTRMAELVAARCNALSATPSMWRKLAMHPQFTQLPLQQITLGGEIVDQNVLDMLARCFPQARITHVYASTEAGVGFVVRDRRAGFPLSYLADAPGGIPMKVDDAGHLWFHVDEWVDSGDVVRVEDGRVYFTGRANGSINVGGNKVMPEEVEAVISELTEVLFVHVRARRNSITGSLVEAAVLPAAGVVLDADLKKRIIAHCRQRLEGFKVPALVVAAGGIPVTPAGKLSRRVP